MTIFLLILGILSFGAGSLTFLASGNIMQEATSVLLLILGTVSVASARLLEVAISIDNRLREQNLSQKETIKSF